MSRAAGLLSLQQLWKRDPPQGEAANSQNFPPGDAIAVPDSRSRNGKHRIVLIFEDRCEASMTADGSVVNERHQWEGNTHLDHPAGLD
jgi:hypothetical protein